MKVLGLIGITFPTSDYTSILQWVSQNLDYDAKVLSYLHREQDIDSKITVIVNRNGGIPLYVKQNLALERHLYNDLIIGDLGPLAFKITVSDIQHTYLLLKTKKLTFTSKILETYDGRLLFWVKDAFNNSFIFEELTSFPGVNMVKKAIYGINSVIIGVSDIGQAIKFYSNLGYKVKTELDYTDDLEPIKSGKKILKRVILERKDTSHILQDFIGKTYLDLVQAQPNKPASISNFKLNFLIDGLNQIDKDYEFEVIDNDEVTFLRAKIYDSNMAIEHNVLDIVRLKFYQTLQWNLKYPKLKISDSKKLKFILNNALEKI